MAGDEEYWVIKIPKPKKLFKAVGRVVGSFAGLLSRSFSVDVPFLLITSLLVGFVLFVVFTIGFRIPDLVAALFTFFLVGLYLLFLRREMRR
ncbi:MAG: hypothetical protein NZ921_02115 [Candidatus Caldarchaeum sp.]|nr:hypothetical protein [Candidatus Caldarchaeum sp.]